MICVTFQTCAVIDGQTRQCLPHSLFEVGDDRRYQFNPVDEGERVAGRQHPLDQSPVT